MPSKSSLQDDAAPAAAGPAPGSQPGRTQRRGDGPRGHGDRRCRVDVRSSRIYVLSRGPVSALVRRMLSVLALVVLDVAGLALGLYLALVVRTIFYGDEIFWSLLWRDGVTEWLPFLIPVTVLVFLQAGMYATRERRSGSGRLVSSLVLIALIVLAFGLGTDYEFTTTGLIPTAVVTCALSIGLLRAAYESISLEVMKVAGIRRRVVLVGEGESLRRLQRELAAWRGGIGFEMVGCGRSRGRARAARARLVARRPACDPRARRARRADPHRVRLRRAHRAAGRRGGAPARREGAARAEDDRAARARGRVRARLRRAAVRAAASHPDRVGLGGEARLRPRRQRPARRRRPAAVAPDRAAIKLGSRGPVFYVDRRVGVGEREFGMLKFRTMVAGAEEQQAALEAANEASGALFKIRDDPRVTRVGRVLRRVSLDEMPQILNVLRGEMSLVGPRPLPLRDFELLEDWHKARYLVLPGMTGLWQISGRLRPRVRRPRAPRLHLPRELVDLARRVDHRQDDPGRDQRPRRVLAPLLVVPAFAARRRPTTAGAVAIRAFLAAAVVFVLPLASAAGGAPPSIVPAGKMSVPRAVHTATALAGGNVLIVGGCSSPGCELRGVEGRLAELYDTREGRFVPTGDLGEWRDDHVASRLPDGRVLVAGGWGVGGVLSTTELYDPVLRRFVPGPAMHSRRAGATATALGNGTVLVAGGFTGNKPTIARAEAFVPAAEAFRAVGAMRAPRGAHAAALLKDGRVLVVGGLSRGRVVATTEIFDPRTGRFTSRAEDEHAALQGCGAHAP